MRSLTLFRELCRKTVLGTFREAGDAVPLAAMIFKDTTGRILILQPRLTCINETGVRLI
jgi:hypothetical protein